MNDDMTVKDLWKRIDVLESNVNAETAFIGGSSKDKLVSAMKTAMAKRTEEPVAELRSTLREKIASIEEGKVRTDTDFINTIVSRLNETSAQDTEVTAVEPEEEKTAEPEETVTEVEESTEVVDGDATKVATKLSLAEMLKKAAAGKAEVESESIPDEDVKTSSDQSESISTLLRNSVLKKVNRVEV